MNFEKYNNLVELFFDQLKTQPKDKIFLSSLKDPQKNLSWDEVKSVVLQLANEIYKIINELCPIAIAVTSMPKIKNGCALAWYLTSNFNGSRNNHMS